jgi:hypothetical protein
MANIDGEMLLKQCLIPALQFGYEVSSLTVLSVDTADGRRKVEDTLRALSRRLRVIEAKGLYVLGYNTDEHDEAETVRDLVTHAFDRSIAADLFSPPMTVLMQAEEIQVAIGKAIFATRHRDRPDIEAPLSRLGRLLMAEVQDVVHQSSGQTLKAVVDAQGKVKLAKIKKRK